MKIDVYNTWGHLRLEEEDERSLVVSALVKTATDGEWHFAESCFICTHWVYHSVDDDLIPVGECRHDPPSIVTALAGRGSYPGVWPTTRGNQFCGAINPRVSQHQLAERVALFCTARRNRTRG